MTRSDENPEHIARIIERLARVSKGIRAMTIGGTSANIHVPRAVIEHHGSAVDGVLADLRGLHGEALPRKVTARDRYSVLLAAWDHAIGGWTCAQCAEKITERTEAHVDHITALARGGSNERDNLQVLCRPCNLRKAAA